MQPGKYSRVAAIEKARNSSALAHAKELESLNSKAQTLEDEVAMYGMSKAAIEELTSARMLDRIEVLKGRDSSAEEIIRIEQIIAARRRLARVGTALDDRKDADKAAQDAEKETKHIADTLHNDVKNALSNAFRDTKNPIAAFGDALGNVIFTRVTNSLADAMATQLLNNGMVKGFMSLFGFADGGSFEQGGVQAFANGGAFHNSVVTQPTLFKFANGGSFRQGIAGEAGPEAVMPLTRGADGRLGVQATGTAKTEQNITVNYNVTTSDVANDVYEFRITIGAGAVRGQINTVAVVIDAPDIVEYLDDVPIAAAGTAIPYTSAFTAIKTITTTLQANASGAITLETDKTTPLSGSSAAALQWFG